MRMLHSFYFFQVRTAVRKLFLFQVHFPNHELTSDWYKDQFEFKILTFWRCHIQVINARAFDIKPMRNLNFLIFNISALIELTIRSGAFDGLQKLARLTITNSKINVNYQIMKPIASTLKKLFFHSIDVTTNMFNFIGGVQMGALEDLNIRDLPFYRIITPHSVTKTPNLQKLMFSECEVEAILARSFDHLQDTLLVLVLWKNKLKTLPEGMLDVIGSKLIHNSLFNNPWECDCPLLYLEKNYLSQICETTTHALYDQCASWRPTLQGRQSKSRKCFDHFGTNSFRVNYPMDCVLTFNSHEQIMYVQCARRTTYSILLAPSGHQRAFCLSATAKQAAFSIQRYSFVDDLIIISIMHPSIKRKVLPLQIISMTIKTSNGWVSAHDKAAILTISVVVCIAVFIIFTLVGIYLVAQYPVLLKGIDRVILVKANENTEIETVLVMPSNWKRRVTTPVGNDQVNKQFVNSVVIKKTFSLSSNGDYAGTPFENVSLAVDSFAGTLFKRNRESRLYMDDPNSPKYYYLKFNSFENSVFKKGVHCMPSSK